MYIKTFLILFILGFFISCSSNRDVVNTPKEETYNPESIGSVK